MTTRPFPLFALLLAATAAMASAQTPPAPEAPAEDELAAAAPTPTATAAEISIKEVAPIAATAKNKDASGHDTLSVDFPDEEIRNILRNVADLFELNLIVPETLQGNASIKLRDVSWRQIFHSVLDPVGYTYVEDGNIIKVVTKEALNDEPTTTEVFILNYARASDISPTLLTLIEPPKGKLVIDARSNSLVITERPTRLAKIRPILEQLDRATDQVMIETKFVEVTDRDVKNIGVNWASLSGYGVGVSGIGGTYNRTQGQQRSTGREGESTSTTGSSSSNSSGTTGTTGTSTTGTQTIGSNSSNTVTSTNGSPGSTSSTGTTSTLGSTTTTSNTSGTSAATNLGSTAAASETLGLLNSLTNTQATDRTLSAVFSADDFQLVLSALQTLNSTKIVSNPTVVTLNNTEATINVGEEYPVPRYSYSEQKGTFEVAGFDFKPIGIILKVTPQVNSRGFIKLTVQPEVSQQNGSVTFGGASGTEIPIIATRKAVTQVSLKDGYTMGIGGMLRQELGSTQSKVPVLGSLPGIGRLFRSDGKSTTTTNLIIFITAKSVSADGAPIEEVFNSDRVRQLELKRSDLPGYRDGTDPFKAEQPKEPARKPAGSGKKTSDETST